MDTRKTSIDTDDKNQSLENIIKDLPVTFTFPESNANDYVSQVIFNILTNLSELEEKTNHYKDDPALGRLQSRVADQLLLAIKSAPTNVIIRALTQSITHPFFAGTAASRTIYEFIAQLFNKELDAELAKQPSDQRKQRIANQLIKLTAHFEPNIRLGILMDASQHKIFYGSSALTSIKHALSKRVFADSPIEKSDKTFDTVQQVARDSHADLEDFLTNPTRLLNWINQANAHEVNLLFINYFKKDSKHYLIIKNQFSEASDPVKMAHAYACYTLMCPGKPTEKGKALIKKAAKYIMGNDEYHFDNVAHSLAATYHANVAFIRKANGLYVNLNRVTLDATDLTDAELPYAQLHCAELNYALLARANLTGANLYEAALSGIDGTACDFSQADLRGANLAAATLAQASLAGANLSGADLSQANLCEADLKGTIFTNAKLDFVDFFSTLLVESRTRFTQYLDNLHDMLSGNPDFERLQLAVANSLVSFLQSETSKLHAQKNILATALSHPFFQEYGQNHYLKVAGNALSSTAITVTNAFFSYFKPKSNDNNNFVAPPYETPAQKMLRTKIANIEQTLSESLAAKKSRNNRPPPPTQVPSPPDEKGTDDNFNNTRPNH